MLAFCCHDIATEMLPGLNGASILLLVTRYVRLRALLRPCRLTANVMEGSAVLFPAEVRPSQREGAYEVSFKPEMSGVYGLAVSLEGGRALKGSPYPVRAKTDETVACNCKMYGGGLTRAVAGQETSFTIQGRWLMGHVHGTAAMCPLICHMLVTVLQTRQRCYTYPCNSRRRRCQRQAARESGMQSHGRGTHQYAG